MVAIQLPEYQTSSNSIWYSIHIKVCTICYYEGMPTRSHNNWSINPKITSVQQLDSWSRRRNIRLSISHWLLSVSYSEWQSLGVSHLNVDSLSCDVQLAAISERIVHPLRYWPMRSLTWYRKLHIFGWEWWRAHNTTVLVLCDLYGELANKRDLRRHREKLYWRPIPHKWNLGGYGLYTAMFSNKFRPNSPIVRGWDRGRSSKRVLESTWRYKWIREREDVFLHRQLLNDSDAEGYCHSMSGDRRERANGIGTFFTLCLMTETVWHDASGWIVCEFSK